MKPFRFVSHAVLVLVLTMFTVADGRAQAALYVSFGASINVYNSSTGAFTNQLATGISNPWSLVLDSTGRLYTSLYTGDTVAAYNTTNSSLISASFTNPGMFSPTGIAVQNGYLYVASQGSQRISRYDATTGSVVAANFIPNVYNPTAMVIDSSNRLYVTNNNSTVSVYNATTGGLISANFITGIVTPMGLAVDNAGHLYVSAVNGNTVAMYDSLTGSVLNANLIAGLTNPRALTLDPLGNLYVSSFNTTNSSFIVGKYNALTGAAINPNLLLAGSNIGGLGFVPAAVPEPATTTALVAALALGVVGWRRRQRSRA